MERVCDLAPAPEARTTHVTAAYLPLWARCAGWIQSSHPVSLEEADVGRRRGELEGGDTGDQQAIKMAGDMAASFSFGQGLN